MTRNRSFLTVTFYIEKLMDIYQKDDVTGTVKK